MTAKILVVEDESDIRELICLHLKRQGFAIDEATNGQEALQKISQSNYDLLVLDWMLPELSGLEIAKEVRKSKKTAGVAILMVTAKGSSNDIILGLESGADDYLVKPFDISVLLARVNALLRRLQKNNDSGDKIQMGALILDIAAHKASCSGAEVILTPYEFKLLEVLARHKGRVLTRDQLINLVQGEDVAVIERAIDTHVFGLRKKLGPCADLIETVRGVGYRVAAE